MVFEKYVDNDLKRELREFLKGLKALDSLSNDVEVNGLLDQANRVAISRLGYNDHGKVHAKIVAVNALKIQRILEAKGVRTKIVEEEIAVLLSSYLHDLGMSVTRDNHDLVSFIIARPIVERLLKTLYEGETTKTTRMLPIILEGILCHLGNYRATSTEAKIVATADGTDMTKGRARIPFEIGRPDIHKFSALSIEKVRISEGLKKPVRISVEMDDPTGIFQVEEILLKKARSVGFEDHLEVVALIKGGREVVYP
jgi:metal-dependent HD superfamily phosphatase/phosphodiesterase